jgi:hypothetical protein
MVISNSTHGVYKISSIELAMHMLIFSYSYSFIIA